MAATAVAVTPETEETAPWLELFARRSKISEPEGITALREQAIERFGELGFPTPRQEAWRATNVAPIARGEWGLPTPPTPPTAAEPDGDALQAARPWTFPAAATLTFLDGKLISTARDLPPGLVAMSLAQALAEMPAEVELHLGRHASFANHSFVALNTALWQDGAYVRLAPGTVIAEPIHLLFLSTGKPVDGAAPVTFPRNLLVIGESAQATVVESYAALSAPETPSRYFNCAVTELVGGPNSAVDHYKVQRESREAFHLATFEIWQDRSSTFSSHSIALGGAFVRNDVNATLDGEGIDTHLNGLYVVGGTQFVDNHMRVEHAKAHCASHELYKGVLEGKSRAVFNGLIHVRHGAQKTDAKQSNRNLLLSPEAIANSNPQLEIFADDVRCTHGSTVGQLDEDAIFYLRSRGIGAEAARSLLTYAFASDIVERVKVEPVRRDLEEFLFRRLPGGETVRQAV